MPSATRKTSTFENLFADIENDLFAALLEFIGTTFFLLFAFGGTQATSALTFLSSPDAQDKVAQVFSISASFGLSLLVSAWLFFRVTGGLFNPDVALSLFLAGALKPVRFVLYVMAELLGGIAAAAIILALTSGPLYINTTLAPDINRVQGMFLEMFGTAGLCLSVLMLAAEKHRATPFAPIGIGLTLFAGQLWLTYYTGCSMNTARAFGPAVVSHFPKYHWIYWVGPGLGSLLASTIYALLKHYHYLKLNPNQAATDPRESPPDPLRGWVGTDKEIPAETLHDQGSDPTEDVVPAHSPLQLQNGGASHNTQKMV